jgi:hypothetical protein
MSHANWVLVVEKEVSLSNGCGEDLLTFQGYISFAGEHGFLGQSSKTWDFGHCMPVATYFQGNRLTNLGKGVS